MVSDIQINIKSYFSKLKFEEKSHIYTYKNKDLPSVSKLLHDFVEPVDWDKIAENIAKRDGREVWEVKKEWLDKNINACDRGHEVHLYAEQPYKVKEKRIEDKAVRKFWEELPERYIVVFKELRMVHKLFGYCGTCDVLLFDTYTGTFILVDYKTNEDLFKNYKGKTLREPFNFLEECPFNLYQIQLSLYQILIEQIENIIVSERWIIYFKEENYSKYKVQNYIVELKEYLCKQ